MEPQTEQVEPDFTFVRLESRFSPDTFCMDCGKHAEFSGKSISKGFKKKLCPSCVNKYQALLNFNASNG